MVIKPCPMCGSADILIVSTSHSSVTGDVIVIEAGLLCSRCRNTLVQRMFPPVGHQIHAELQNRQRKLMGIIVDMWNCSRRVDLEKEITKANEESNKVERDIKSDEESK